MKEYKHILCPVDISKNSKRTLEQAISLQNESNAKLTVMHFVEPLPPSAYAMGVVDAQTGMALVAKESMTKLAKEYSGDADETIVKTARAKDAIAQYAKSEDIDLIVIGKHGHHSALSNLTGSTATRTVNHACCDVFVVSGD